uniref:Exonuclease domain-containing protein n=1 Tax=Megaviridae environmental sample TaxID=1737588 RepID=A0A5J6VK64_9VIRU|nr:MAG: hypothetical protein [Megaviridae environmental sample]
MSICILSTSTNGFHTTRLPVSKKQIFEFARLISLNYIIGDIEDDQFIEKKKVKSILKPKCINFDKKAEEYHGISIDKANTSGKDNFEVMKEFQNDLKGVKHIVSHNLPFHLKSIQVECFRTATLIEFSRYNLIDTISFNHSFEYPKLPVLAEQLEVKVSKNNLRTIKNVFLKLNSK